MNRMTATTLSPTSPTHQEDDYQQCGLPKPRYDQPTVVLITVCNFTSLAI